MTHPEGDALSEFQSSNWGKFTGWGCGWWMVDFRGILMDANAKNDA